ncbi:MAG: response regulator [Verrucomicrobia subdivision 3 bacterium]|nr:response regulator [Limisphaerales bacterium]
MPEQSPVILVAEDNENDVLMLRRAFIQAGITVPLHVVGDGEQTIAYLKGEGIYSNRAEYPLPDLMLLDLKMPRKDGFEVLDWIRHQPSLAAIRVVVLSTSEELRDVNRAYRIGANSFLIKPLNFTEFRTTIQAMYAYWFSMSRAPEIQRPPKANPYFNTDS